ncbi:MAG TPA: hypothetical protein VFH58_16505 [Acidimicrobiales bacterium]|nr:hypothetical protein [Acidimicrobiales bacterium]
MSTSRPPTHEHLLTLANKVKAAAQDGDVERLRAAAWSLYDGLIQHLDAEAFALMHTPPGHGRLLRRGQRRIIDTATAILRDTELSGDECRCRGLAELLAAELCLQAEDERRYLSDLVA